MVLLQISLPYVIWLSITDNRNPFVSTDPFLVERISCRSKAPRTRRLVTYREAWIRVRMRKLWDVSIGLVRSSSTYTQPNCKPIAFYFYMHFQGEPGGIWFTPVLLLQYLLLHLESGDEVVEIFDSLTACLLAKHALEPLEERAWARIAELTPEPAPSRNNASCIDKVSQGSCLSRAATIPVTAWRPCIIYVHSYIWYAIEPRRAPIIASAAPHAINAWATYGH